MKAYVLQNAIINDSEVAYKKKDKIMIRRSTFLRDLSMVGIVRILKIAQHDRRTNELYMMSDIKFRPSFQNYVNFCKEKKFLEIINIPISKRSHKIKPFYRTTDIGHEFLTLLGENN